MVRLALQLAESWWQLSPWVGGGRSWWAGDFCLFSSTTAKLWQFCFVSVLDTEPQAHFPLWLWVICCVLPYHWCFLKNNKNNEQLCIIHPKCTDHAFISGSCFFFFLELALDSACWADHLRGSQQRKGQFSVCSIISAKSAGKYTGRQGCRETKERSFTGNALCVQPWLADRRGWGTLFCLLMATMMKLTKIQKNLAKTFSLVMAKFLLLRSEGKILKFSRWDQKHLNKLKLLLKRDNKYLWCVLLWCVLLTKKLIYFVLIMVIAWKSKFGLRCIDLLVVVVLDH